MCAHVPVCVNTCLSKGRAACIDTNWWSMEQNFASGFSGPETKPPTDKPNTEDSHRYTISVNSGLSSPQVIGHTLFHWMQLPLGRVSVWDSSSVISLPTVHQIISSCTVGGLSALTSYSHEPTDPLSIIMCLITTDRRESASLDHKCKENREGFANTYRACLEC